MLEAGANSASALIVAVCDAVPAHTLLEAIMAEQPALKNVDAATIERRRRVALRALIDEMLVEIRGAANREEWTPEARARAEADLARIMEQVKREALSTDGRPR